MKTKSLVLAIAAVFAAFALSFVGFSTAWAEGENVFDGDDTIGVTYVTHANAAVDWGVASASQLTFANSGFTPENGTELASSPYVVNLDRYASTGNTEWTRTNNVSVALPPVSSYPHAGVYQWQISETPLNLPASKWSQSSPVYRMTAYIGNSDNPAGLYYVNWYIEQVADDSGTAIASPEKINAGYDSTSASEMDFGLDYIKSQTLSVSKEVEGAFGDKSYAFPIRTTLYLPDWYAEQGQTVPAVMYSDNTEAGVPTWDNSAHTWVLQVTNNLADSQSKVFNVPVGTRYEVREMDANANGAEYTPSVSWTTQMGVNSITYVSDVDGYAGTVFRSGNLDGSATVAMNPFGRKGMKVTSWNTAADGVSGTSYAPGDSIDSLDSDMTLYAAGWEKRTYTLNFVSSIGDGIENISGLEYDDVIDNVPDAQFAGCRFEGWATQPYGSGVQLVNGETKVSDLIPNDSEDGTVKLIASWRVITYNIVYDLQGGTTTYTQGSVSKTYQQNNFYPTPLTRRISNDGLVFGGWFTEPNGQGLELVNKSQKLRDFLTFDDAGPDFTFYAYWRHEAILYNANADDATGSIEPSQKDTTTGNATVSSSTFTRPGYTFTGWNTQADGLGTGYSAGDAIALTDSDVTLYAQWEKTYITVTYMADTDPDGYVLGELATRTVWVNDYFEDLTPPVNYSHSVNGWCTSKNIILRKRIDSSMTIAEVAKKCNSSWDGVSDITVYVYTSARVYTVSPVLPEGASASSNVGQWGVTVNLIPATMSCYTFEGWSVSPSENIMLESSEKISDIAYKAFNAGQRTQVDENPIPIYPVFTPNEYTVVYDYQYDSLTDETVTLGPNGPEQLVDRPASRAGYTFLGWNTKSDGTGTWVTADKHFYELVRDWRDGDATLNLYAQWQAN